MNPIAKMAHDHRFVAEYRLAGKGRKDVRRHAHAGKDRDVDFRVAEEPEQVLPEQWRAALVRDQLIADYQAAGNEEARPADAVEQQQNASRQKNRKRQQRQNRSRKPGPAR